MVVSAIELCLKVGRPGLLASSRLLQLLGVRHPAPGRRWRHAGLLPRQLSPLNYRRSPRECHHRRPGRWRGAWRCTRKGRPAWRCPQDWCRGGAWRRARNARPAQKECLELGRLASLTRVLQYNVWLSRCAIHRSCFGLWFWSCAKVTVNPPRASAPNVFVPKRDRKVYYKW